jgi:hypothetical protein
MTQSQETQMLKKMTLLVGLALAAIAFAVPASASAQVWNGTHEDSLTGFLAFGNPAAGQTKFGCVVHISVEVEGGTDTGAISSFNRTTETCVGEGAFTGCELVEDETTGLPATFTLTGTNEATMSNAGVVIHNVYDAACPIESSTLTVPHLTMSGTNTNLTDVTITFIAQAHYMVRGVGETTSNVALFGTIGTEADTITIS